MEQVDLLVRSWIESFRNGRGDHYGVVDLLVRSWIERDNRIKWANQCFGRPPCEVVNWKVTFVIRINKACVDLLVRSWIERFPHQMRNKKMPCRPPCEVVNWKLLFETFITLLFVDLLVRSWIERDECDSSVEPMMSTSLWGRELKGLFCRLHKPRISSTSLWGRELKDHVLYLFFLYFLVDLLVRSWIERMQSTLWYS